ncbi:MAG: hypothetical protein ACREPP_05190 [Rhodanobacteraceae bacterium]
MNHNIHLCAFAICALPLVFAPVLHAANTCDPIYNAGIKSIQTPHHVYSTVTMGGGKPQTGEAIYAGGVEYLQLNGKWMHSPVSHAEMMASAQEKLKTHPDTCTLVGDQTVDGQAVSVYKVHNNETGTNQTVRIRKSSGLMQSGSLTLPDGSVVEGRYEYDHVQAPAGVN